MAYHIGIVTSKDHLSIAYQLEGDHRYQSLDPLGGYGGKNVPMVLAQDEEGSLYVGEQAYYDDQWQRQHVRDVLKEEEKVLSLFEHIVDQTMTYLWEIDPQANISAISLLPGFELAPKNRQVLGAYLGRRYDCPTQVMTRQDWVKSWLTHEEKPAAIWLDNDQMALWSPAGEVLIEGPGFDCFFDQLCDLIVGQLATSHPSAFEAMATDPSMREGLQRQVLAKLGWLIEKAKGQKPIRLVVQVGQLPYQLQLEACEIKALYGLYEPWQEAFKGWMKGEGLNEVALLVTSLNVYQPLLRLLLANLGQDLQMVEVEGVMTKALDQPIIYKTFMLVEERQMTPFAYQEAPFVIEWEEEDKAQGFLFAEHGQGTVAYLKEIEMNKEEAFDLRTFKIEGASLKTYDLVMEDNPILVR